MRGRAGVPGGPKAGQAREAQEPSAAREPPRVTVVGSLNTDISLAVPHLPGPGETVLSPAGAVTGGGGKGANQAVAAARLGAAVRMVGCCGDDEFGARLRAGLAAEGVDAGGVRVIAGAASGVALITVDAAGENAIAVAAGANGLAGQEEVTAAFAAPCDALVLSAEIPAGVLADVLARAREAGVRCVLNLAPVPDGAAGLLAGGVDWLVVNELEAAAVLGRPVAGPPAAELPATAEPPAAGAAGAAGLTRMGARHAVVTLGPAGAVLASAPDAAGDSGMARDNGADRVVTVPGFTVASVDSVGAGDAFVAALAVALAAGMAPADAVRVACAAGAAATTRRGAQAALPHPADVLTATGIRWPVGDP
jgi:ribokinase